jgi:beta-lactamase regulating signal transducer with metallopeptidase domain
MMLFPALQSFSSVAFERLLYCLTEGSILTLAIAIGMRFIPQKSSRTKFVIWFSAMVATALLPLLDLKLSGKAGGIISAHAVITIPFTVAFYVACAWFVLAFLGLLRVAMAVWQLHRLRQDCIELTDQQLAPEVQQIVSEFRKHRPVSILMSGRVQVPTAVGLFKSSVILPAWMMEEAASEEVKHVILHELAHLRRRDDWTNLVQKIVKAVLFFHPGIWWMERELSLQREMACDDKVLEHTASPRTYAECLARVAEKSFMRRHIALAQAAVSRIRQLSVRVGRILDPKRSGSTQTWKPAVPGVIVLAVISGVSVACAPDLVGVGSETRTLVAATKAQTSAETTSPLHMVKASAESSSGASEVRTWPAEMRTNPVEGPTPKSLYVPARHIQHRRATAAPGATQDKARHVEHPPVIMAGYTQPKQTNGLAEQQAEKFVLVIETRQVVTAGADGWHLSVQQLRWLVPVNQIQKSIPSKT